MRFSLHVASCALSLVLIACPGPAPLIPVGELDGSIVLGGPTDGGVVSTVLDAGEAGRDSGIVTFADGGSGRVDAGSPGEPPGRVVLFTLVGEQRWRVPSNVARITVRLWGAGGASGLQRGATGGGGAYVQATVPVTPGEELVVAVGQGGIAPSGGAGMSALARGPGVEWFLAAAGGGGGGSTICGGACATAPSGGRGGAGGRSGEAGQAFTGAASAACMSALGGGGAKYVNRLGGEDPLTGEGGAGGAVSGSTTGCPGQEGSWKTGGATQLVGAACSPGQGAWQWRASRAQTKGGGAGGAGDFGGGAGGAIDGYCAGGGGGGANIIGAGATNVTQLDGVTRFPGYSMGTELFGSGGVDETNMGLPAHGTGGAVRIYYLE